MNVVRRGQQARLENTAKRARISSAAPGSSSVRGICPQALLALGIPFGCGFSGRNVLMFCSGCRIKPPVSVPFSKGVDAHTRYRAVLGHPVRHSASPEMQNAGMAALGLNWRYLAFDVEPGGLGRAIAGAAALELWTGKPAPVEEMRKALLQKLLGKSN